MGRGLASQPRKAGGTSSRVGLMVVVWMFMSVSLFLFFAYWRRRMLTEAPGKSRSQFAAEVAEKHQEL
jgi:hypothetical protein